MAVQNEHFAEEALRLVTKADELGIRLRILGSVAYRLHSPANIHLFAAMERALTDVDLAAERSQNREIRAFMAGEGYVADEGIFVASEGERHIYTHRETKLNVDVFADQLYFCHPIPFKGRLHLDYPTITTTDLLLEKMQIVEINPKDIKDTLVLLLEHPAGDPSAGRENIDIDYIAGIMGADWGFHHTFTTNLKRVSDAASGFPGLEDGQGEIIRARAAAILARLDAEPKSMKWKLRAKIGTRAKWYQEVSDKGRVF